MHVYVYGMEIPVIIKQPAEMGDDWGRFNDNESEEIWIRSDVPAKMRRRTISHEMFHAVMHLSGHSHLCETIDEHAEEAIVRALDAALGDLICFPEDVEKWIASKEAKPRRTTK